MRKDPAERWQLSEVANRSDQDEWSRILDLPNDRKSGRDAARSLQRLWRRGAIVTIPSDYSLRR